ncbi:hypothetical protein QL285_081565 [Trifolium repens]|nr:hypothetical protein QL285_081565 [Trifolium repens]
MTYLNMIIPSPSDLIFKHQAKKFVDLRRIEDKSRRYCHFRIFTIEALIHHFSTLCARLEDQSYDETKHGANKYSPRSGEPSISSKMFSLDRLLGCDIDWASYAAHRATLLLEDYAFTLASSDVEAPRPFTVTAPATTLITASVQFANFRDLVLTAAQRGPLAIYPWYAAPGYMR